MTIPNRALNVPQTVTPPCRAVVLIYVPLISYFLSVRTETQFHLLAFLYVLSFRCSFFSASFFPPFFAYEGGNETKVKNKKEQKRKQIEKGGGGPFCGGFFHFFHLLLYVFVSPPGGNKKCSSRRGPCLLWNRIHVFGRHACLDARERASSTVTRSSLTAPTAVRVTFLSRVRRSVLSRRRFLTVCALVALLAPDTRRTLAGSFRHAATNCTVSS